MKIVITENQLKYIRESDSSYNNFTVDELYQNLLDIDEPMMMEKNPSPNKKVAAIQLALSLLGYDLPKYGVDGKLGEETKNAIDKFKKDHSLNESHYLTEGEDIKGIDELVYNPVTASKDSVGFGYDRGKKVNMIKWKNHDNHLHMGFTDRDVAMAVIDKANELGLHTGENWYSKTGKVHNVHVKGSFHYKEFPGEPKVGAGVDITGDKTKIEELIIWVNEKYANNGIDFKKEKDEKSPVITPLLSAGLAAAITKLSLGNEDIKNFFTAVKEKGSDFFSKVKETGGSIIDKIKNYFDPSEEENDVDVIFMGGLDDKPGYLNLSEQTNLLKTNLGGKTVESRRYTQIDEIKKLIKQNPNASVVLFSAGCRYASDVADMIKDKSKLYILEPHFSATGSVGSAVTSGVPTSNVIVGHGKGRGEYIASNPTKTPKGMGHFDSLKFVGTLVK